MFAFRGEIFASSIDGKETAYLENRQTLKVYTIGSEESRTSFPAISTIHMPTAISP